MNTPCIWVSDSFQIHVILKPKQYRTSPYVNAWRIWLNWNQVDSMLSFYQCTYQWRLVTFQPEDAVQSTLHFLKFYFNLSFFFLQISSNTALFSLFFKFNIRFFKNIFWDLRSKRILLCVSKPWLVCSTLSYFQSYILRVLRNGLVQRFSNHLHLFLFCILLVRMPIH